MTNRPNTRSVADQTATKQSFTIGDAADRLGVSSEAVRMRLKRGTLDGAKVDGRWVVYLELSTEQPTQRDQTPDQTATEQPTKHITERDQTALVESQREEIAYLRDQLDRALRSSEAERERADILHREALTRIEALASGPVQEPETTTDPLIDPQEGLGATEAGAMSPDTLHEPSIVASWFRRLFGRT